MYDGRKVIQKDERNQQNGIELGWVCDNKTVQKIHDIKQFWWVDDSGTMDYFILISISTQPFPFKKFCGFFFASMYIKLVATFFPIKMHFSQYNCTLPFGFESLKLLTKTPSWWQCGWCCVRKAEIPSNPFIKNIFKIIKKWRWAGRGMLVWLWEIY